MGGLSFMMMIVLVLGAVGATGLVVWLATTMARRRNERSRRD